MALVDRAMSTNEKHHPPTPSHHPAPSNRASHLAQPASSRSSSLSGTSAVTSTLQSELDRDLTQGESQPSSQHLYSEVASPARLPSQSLTHQDSSIDPNLDPQLTNTRSKSPELDIFAMLERMSVKGSVHNRTSQFYDTPPPAAPISMLQRQRSQNMHNPQPISVAEQADISALEEDADETRRSSSLHSFHTIRPTSATGIHERFEDSPRSSTAGSKALANPREQTPNQNTPRGSHHHAQRDPGTTPTPQSRSRVPSHASSPAPSRTGTINPPTFTTPKGRGAWSDLERHSAHTDNEVVGAVPRRAVQRDLQRILKTIERNDSKLIVKSNSLGDHLDNIQNQLQNVAAKLKGHQLERDGNGTGAEEPTIADKVDYMLSLYV